MNSISHENFLKIFSRKCHMIILKQKEGMIFLKRLIRILSLNVKHLNQVRVDPTVRDRAAQSGLTGRSLIQPSQSKRNKHLAQFKGRQEREIW